MSRKGSIRDVRCKCGAYFLTTDRRKVYCSTPCKVAFGNARRETTQEVPRPCEVCGMLFKPLQKRGVGRKCCSPECEKVRKMCKYERKRRDLSQEIMVGSSEYKAHLVAQNGLCAICGREERVANRKLLCADHDHMTGKFRGLLCMLCNIGLGIFDDSPETLKAARDYILGS